MRLWDFAVSIYTRPGVESVCLTLQDDHDQCVPLLLWRLWALDRSVGAAMLGSAIDLARDWDRRVVAPLRTIRRDLAAPAPPIPDTDRQSLRDVVKAAELAAERAVLDCLEALTPKAAPQRNLGAEALAELAECWSRPAPITLLSHLADAAASVTGCSTADRGYGHER